MEPPTRSDQTASIVRHDPVKTRSQTASDSSKKDCQTLENSTVIGVKDEPMEDQGSFSRDGEDPKDGDYTEEKPVAYTKQISKSKRMFSDALSKTGSQDTVSVKPEAVNQHTQNTRELRHKRKETSGLEDQGLPPSTKSRSRVKELERQLVEMQNNHAKALSEKEHSFAKMEAELVARIPVSKVKILPDNIIRQELQAIQSAIICWCRTWVSSSRSLQNIDQVSSVLSNGTIDCSGKNLDRLSKHFVGWKIGPRILLTSLVSKNLIEKILKNPFATLQVDTMPLYLEKICTTMYEALAQSKSVTS